MPKITFLPSNQTVEVDVGTKVLIAAKKGKVEIRFGCAACKCGTCAAEVDDAKKFAPMEGDERALLTKIGLPTTGKIRLSCRAKIQDQDSTVDLTFQNTYDPYFEDDV